MDIRDLPNARCVPKEMLEIMFMRIKFGNVTLHEILGDYALELSGEENTTAARMLFYRIVDENVEANGAIQMRRALRLSHSKIVMVPTQPMSLLRAACRAHCGEIPYIAFKVLGDEYESVVSRIDQLVHAPTCTDLYDTSSKRAYYTHIDREYRRMNREQSFLRHNKNAGVHAPDSINPFIPLHMLPAREASGNSGVAADVSIFNVFKTIVGIFRLDLLDSTCSRYMTLEEYLMHVSEACKDLVLCKPGVYLAFGETIWRCWTGIWPRDNSQRVVDAPMTHLPPQSKSFGEPVLGVKRRMSSAKEPKSTAQNQHKRRKMEENSTKATKPPSDKVNHNKQNDVPLVEYDRESSGSETEDDECF